MGLQLPAPVPVIPAKAGIQLSAVMKEGWIPAFAGMTSR